MAEEWTCGKGLAAHASVPISIGKLLAAMAEMLDLHTHSLDPGQENGRIEYAAYASLVAQHRIISKALDSMGREMAGYEHLQMAEHDMEVLMSGEFDAAFRAVVAAEKGLCTTLQSTIAEHEQMLEAEQG